MRAIMMAAGKGTRLLPLTATRPKPMMPLLNQPIMDSMLSLVKSAGIDDVTILVDYLSEQIVSHVGDGSKFGLKVDYTADNIRRGTAGAVRNAAEGEKEPFLVVSADVLTTIDLRKMIDAHSNSNAHVTMMLASVSDTSQYGVAMLDERGRITRFHEKPRREDAFSNLVNAGIYVCSPDILPSIPDDTEFDFSRQLFPLMLKSGQQIGGYRFSGYWNDVGMPSTYLAATQDMVDGKLEEDALARKNYSDEPAYGRLITGRNCHIDASASIDGWAVMGDNVRIGKDVKLSRSIIYSNTQIGDSSLISEAIVGEGVSIDGAVTLDQGVVIGDGTRIGSDSRIGHNIKIWHHSRLGSGTKMLHT